MSDVNTPDVERPGIDRRTLIKRAAATGTIAWVAPVIIDSLASPAAALTCGTCFIFQIDEDCGGAVAATETVSALCPIATPAGCTGSPTALTAGRPFSSICFTATDCVGFDRQFDLDTTSNTCWTAGTCGANRRFLAARARLTDGTCLFPASLTDSTVTFERGVFQLYDFFRFIVGCTCA
jgi:hypothetical protein